MKNVFSKNPNNDVEVAKYEQQIEQERREDEAERKDFAQWSKKVNKEEARKLKEHFSFYNR
jgi:hypothetical protein